MELASRDAELRAALFRFVDVVPACRSLEDLARHLSAFLHEVDERPPSLDAAMRMADSKAGARALGLAATAGVRHMAHRFIVGETPHDALAAAGRSVAATASPPPWTCSERRRSRWRRPTVTRNGAALRCVALARGIRGVAAAAGAGARFGGPDPAREPEREGVGAHAAPAPGGARRSESATRPARLRDLMQLARDLGAHLHVDMESLDSRETVLGLVLELLAEDEFAEGPSAGVVVQAYLRDSSETVEQVLDWAREHPRAQPLVVRLVKGAYWDQEIVEARRHGWPAPVFEEKAESDRNFEALTRRLLEARPLVRVAVASHNLRSVAHAIACNRALGAPDGDLELQVLRGLGDDLQHALAAAGPARADVLPGRRPRRRDGVPGAQAAREHEQRVVPGGTHARRECRGAARRAVKPFVERTPCRAAPRRRCARACSRRCAISRRRCRGACRCGSATSASPARTSSRPIPGDPERVVATCAAARRRRTSRRRWRRPQARRA